MVKGPEGTDVDLSFDQSLFATRLGRQKLNTGHQTTIFWMQYLAATAVQTLPRLDQSAKRILRTRSSAG
jgi:hypothetical protein